MCICKRNSKNMITFIRYMNDHKINAKINKESNLSCNKKFL